MAVDYHLEGQVAVITGSTSGIGQALATALAEQGVNVVLNGFGDPAKIEADRAQMKLDMERGLLVRVRDVENAASRAGVILVRQLAE